MQQTPPRQRSISQSLAEHRVLLMRLAIIAAVLILSITVAPRGIDDRFVLLIALAGAALAALVIYLKQPSLGLVALVFAGLLIPLRMGPSGVLNSTVIVVSGLAALWILTSVVRDKALVINTHPAQIILFIFAVVVLLSFIAGQVPWFDIDPVPLEAQFAGLAIFLLSIVAFMLTAHLIDELWLRRIVFLFLGLGALALIVRLLQLEWQLPEILPEGARGSEVWIWITALAAGQALFNTKLPSSWRCVLGILAVATPVITLVTSPNWASGWLPSAIALSTVLFIRFPRTALVIVPFVALFMLASQDNLMDMATSEESWFARRQAWEIVLETSQVNPILGLGPVNYYSYVQGSTIAGWGGYWNVGFSSHNNYIDLIAQTGIAGILLFLAFAAAIGNVAWKLYQSAPGGFVRGFAAGSLGALIASLVAGMLGDWIIPFVYNVTIDGLRASILFWVFLGALLAMWLAQDAAAE